MRVDAHHHVWRVARGDYGWLRPESPICRDYSLGDLRPLLGDIDATVLVQAAPTEAETRFMLDAARGSAGMVRGVVGWVPLEEPERVAALAAEPLLRGLRPMLHDLPEPDWILRPGLGPALEEMAARGLVFDALVRPVHLSSIRALAARHPRLRIVLDHGGKPEIAVRRMEPWAGEVAALARCPNVTCKLSGLVTEAAPGWQAVDLRPYVAHLLRAFGAGRLMWGSDWPVVDLAGGYAAWREASLTLLEGLTETDRARILGGTAAEVYRL
ncbi:amidohydrolase family protein [Belnapia sp. T18]|uniref:Amidohydrolase family protein n=1 Tax=Belnapia arida TaxID=2804533 RepID=A0ABS1U543_9PROT|nr:amidohydrolase family protein [Belnapia arida]MBL6079665.1 amidohydrolase family protein [Belnapia arida]